MRIEHSLPCIQIQEQIDFGAHSFRGAGGEKEFFPLVSVEGESKSMRLAQETREVKVSCCPTVPAE